jgi:fucose 4-O-acetylase-like acetyltransferase
MVGRRLSENRVEWIDVCKGIGIFLVVLGHVYQDSPTKTWIYSFHMPLFFFLSGYLFDPNKLAYRQFIKRRFLSLVVPYFSFATICYLYWAVIERYFRPKSMGVGVYEPILAYLYGTRSSGMEPNMVLWFLPCLFVTEMLFLFISKSLRRRDLICLALVLFSVNGYWGLYRGFRMPWSIDAAFNAIVFYGIGYLIKENLSEIKIWMKGILRRKIVFAILIFSLGFLISTKNGYTTIDHHLNNYLYYYLGALCGIGALVLFSKSIKWPGFVISWGRNALIILGLHDAPKRIVIKGVSVVTNIPTDALRDSFLGGIICSVLIMFFLAPLIWVINKYFGFLLGRFGKREALTSIGGRP